MTMTTFKDLKLNGLAQDDQIHTVRKALREGKFGIFEDEEFAKWTHENKDRIIEMSLVGELDE